MYDEIYSQIKLIQKLLLEKNIDHDFFYKEIIISFTDISQRLNQESGLLPQTQVLLTEEKILKQQIIEKIKKQLDREISKISEGKEAETVSWIIYLEQVGSEEDKTTYDEKVTNARNYFKVKTLLEAQLEKIDHLFNSESTAAKLKNEYDNLSKELESQKNLIEFLTNQLSDENRTLIVKLKTDYESKYSEFIRNQQDLQVQFSEATTLMTSHAYKTLLDQIENLEFRGRTEIELPYSSEFDSEKGVFLNESARTFTLSNAKNVTLDRWKIWSSWKYGEYIRSIGNKLPGESDPINQNPREQYAIWKEDLAKGLMPLNEINDTDLNNQVRNLELLFKRLIDRFEKIENELIRYSKLPDTLTCHKQLTKYGETILKDSPCLKDLYEDFLSKSNKSVDEFLDRQVLTFERKFIINPNQIQFDVDLIIKKMPEFGFSAQRKKLADLKEASSEFRTLIDSIEALDDFDAVVEKIYKYEEILSSKGFESPDILKTKKEIALIFRDSQAVITELKTTGRKLISEIETNLSKIDKNKIEETLGRINSVVEIINKPLNKELHAARKDSESLKEIQAKLIELQAYFQIKNMIDSRDLDLAFLKRKFDLVKSNILLSDLVSEKKRFEKMEQNDLTVKKELNAIQSTLGEEKNISDRINQYAKLISLINRPSRHKSELEATEQKLSSIIEPYIQSLLQDIDDNNLISVHKDLESSHKYFKLKHSNAELPKQVKIFLAKANAKIAENGSNWLEAYRHWNSIRDDVDVQGQMYACLKLFILTRAMEKDFSPLQQYILRSDPLYNDGDLRNLREYKTFLDIDLILKNTPPDQMDLTLLDKQHQSIINQIDLEDKQIAENTNDWQLELEGYEEKNKNLINSFRNEFPANDLPEIIINRQIVYKSIKEITSIIKKDNKLSEFYEGVQYKQKRLSLIMSLEDKELFNHLWTQFHISSSWL